MPCELLNVEGTLLSCLQFMLGEGEGEGKGGGEEGREGDGQWL